MTKLFTGSHSTKLINLDNVEFVEADGPHVGELTVYFRSGLVRKLKGADAAMFVTRWNEISDIAEPGSERDQRERGLTDD